MEYQGFALMMDSHWCKKRTWQSAQHTVSANKWLLLLFSTLFVMGLHKVWDSPQHSSHQKTQVESEEMHIRGAKVEDGFNEGIANSVR